MERIRRPLRRSRELLTTLLLCACAADPAGDLDLDVGDLARRDATPAPVDAAPLPADLGPLGVDGSARADPPDAAPPAPDAVATDAAVDATTAEPDAGLDAARPLADAAVADAAVADAAPAPDAAPATCYGAPRELAALEAVEPDVYRLTAEAGHSRVLVGTCGADGDERIFDFVAPVAGDWTFAFDARTRRQDQRVHARRDCEDIRTEVGCIGHGAFSLRLAQGETLALALDSAQSRGEPFELGIFRADDAEPPVIEDALAVRAPLGGITLRVDAVDRNGDMVGVVARRADATGALLEEPFEGPDVYVGNAVDSTMVGQRHARGHLWAGFHNDFVSVTVVDARGLESAPVLVPVVAPERREAGAPCDLAGVDGLCAARLLCVLEGEAGICRAPSPPEIVDATAYRSASGGFHIDYAAHDATQDLDAIAVSLLRDDSDEPVPLDELGSLSGSLSIDRYPAASDYTKSGPLWGSHGIVFAPAFPEVTRVLLVPLDRQWLSGPAFVVPLTEAPAVEPQDLCGAVVCGAEERCTDVRGEFEPACLPDESPVVDTAEVYISREGEIGYHFTGHGRGRWVTHAEIQLLTAYGDRPLALAVSQRWPIRRALGEHPDGPVELSGRVLGAPVQFPVPLRRMDVPTATRMRFVLSDIGDERSREVVLDLGVPMPQVDEGGACDVARAVSECLDGLHCEGPDNSVAVCVR